MKLHIEKNRQPSFIIKFAFAVVALGLMASHNAAAADINKAANNTPLNQGASWVGGIAPGPDDVAVWDGVGGTASHRRALLGDNLTWAGIRIENLNGGSLQIPTGNSLTLGALGITMTNAGNNRNLTFSNDVSLGASQIWYPLNAGGTKEIQVVGSLSGDADKILIKEGTGYVRLENANTFAGPIIVNDGRLYLEHSAALGSCPSVTVNSTTGGTAANSGTIVALGNAFIPNTVSLSLTCNVMGNVRSTLLCSDNNGGEWSGPISLIGDNEIHFNANGNPLVVSGPVTGNDFTGVLQLRGGTGPTNTLSGTVNLGTGVLRKADSGIWLITSSGNTWSGTYIINGTLQLGAHNALPPSTTVTNDGGNAQAALDLNGFNQEVTGLARRGSTPLWIVNDSTSSDSTLTFRGSESWTLSGAGGLRDGFGGRRIGLTMESGELALTGINAYSGDTRVNGGKLTVMTTKSWGGVFTVADGATLEVTVANKDGSLIANSLSLGTAATSTLNLDLGGFGNPSIAPINVSDFAGFSVNGNVTLNLKGFGLLAGQFPLIQYFGVIGGAGGFTLGTLPLGVVSASLVTNELNSTLDLNITLAAGAAYWNGNLNSDWDINTTFNWKDMEGFSVTYAESVAVGDIAYFNDF